MDEPIAQMEFTWRMPHIYALPPSANPTGARSNRGAAWTSETVVLGGGVGIEGGVGVGGIGVGVGSGVGETVGPTGTDR